jgi:hypothetical protein
MLIRLAILALMSIFSTIHLYGQLYLNAYRQSANARSVVMPGEDKKADIGSWDTCGRKSIEWEWLPNCTYVQSSLDNLYLTINRGSDHLRYRLLGSDTICAQHSSGETFTVRLNGVNTFIDFPTRIDYRIYGHIEKEHMLYYHQTVTYIGLSDTFYKVYISHEHEISLRKDTLIGFGELNYFKLRRLHIRGKSGDSEYYLNVFDTRTNILYLFKPNLCYVGMMNIYPYRDGCFQGTGKGNNHFNDLRYGMEVTNSGLGWFKFNKASENRRLRRFLTVAAH